MLKNERNKILKLLTLGYFVINFYNPSFFSLFPSIIFISSILQFEIFAPFLLIIYIICYKKLNIKI